MFWFQKLVCFVKGENLIKIFIENIIQRLLQLVSIGQTISLIHYLHNVNRIHRNRAEIKYIKNIECKFCHSINFSILNLIEIPVLAISTLTWSGSVCNLLPNDRISLHFDQNSNQFSRHLQWTSQHFRYTQIHIILNIFKLFENKNKTI